MIYNDILYRKLPFLVSKITPIPTDPNRPLPQFVARLRRRIQHDTPPPVGLDPLAHMPHGWAGECCVVGAPF